MCENKRTSVFSAFCVIFSLAWLGHMLEHPPTSAPTPRVMVPTISPTISPTSIVFNETG